MEVDSSGESPSFLPFPPCKQRMQQRPFAERSHGYLGIDLLHSNIFSHLDPVLELVAFYIHLEVLMLVNC